jgi:hypothetical protein
MKVMWILYMIACPNCEWEVMNTYDTKVECIREKKYQERIRSGIGYWNDSARFECIEIHELHE